MEKKKFYETDLYAPICDFLKKEGFVVKSEVKGCDVTAQKGDRLIIVELKKSFQLSLLYQAIERQSYCQEVFVAIPRPEKPQNTKQWKNMIKLLKRLELGLFTVALDSPLHIVDVILEPSDSMIRKNKTKKQKLLLELEGRSGDYNVGGMTRRKVITAYREKALELCCILQQQKEVDYALLRRYGLLEPHIKMLGTNVYKWYKRVKKGVYCLSEEGKKALDDEQYFDIVAYYKKKWREKNNEFTG